MQTSEILPTRAFGWVVISYLIEDELIFICENNILPTKNIIICSIFVLVNNTGCTKMIKNW